MKESPAQGLGAGREDTNVAFDNKEAIVCSLALRCLSKPGMWANKYRGSTLEKTRKFETEGQDSQ